MFPPQELGEKLAAARQATIAANNADAAVDSARTALATAEQGVEDAKATAAAARHDAMTAVGAWLDSPVEPDAPATTGETTQGAATDKQPAQEEAAS